MSGEKLSEEAENFIKNKTRKYTAQEKTSLRFYFGNAITGLMGSPGLVGRDQELLEQAFHIARLALEFEEKRF